MRRLPLCALVIGALLFSSISDAQRKKKTKKTDEEPVTQTLEILPEPPAALTVETKRLDFAVAPLSGHGLLSQQVRNEVRALWRAAGSSPLVKIRAFVAGTGDLRRVQVILAEMYNEKHLPMPVLSVVQVGALPLNGAQAQLEAVSQDARKLSNPNGLAFVSGQQAPTPAESISRLKTALAAAEPLRIACFVAAADDMDRVRMLIGSAFPTTPFLIAQTQRAPVQPVTECEAVARLKSAPATEVQFLNPDGLARSPNYSQIALVAAPHLVLSSAQLAFRYEEADARLAFERLERTLAGVNSSLKQAVMVNAYPLSPQLAELVRKVRFDFLDKSRPPASTLLPFEGLPGMDASISLEVVAVPKS